MPLLGRELTGQAGLTLRLARLKPAVRALLARDGVVDRVGEENIRGNVDHAVKAQLAAQGDSRADR
jgi:SulP family sulfate permease